MLTISFFSSLSLLKRSFISLLGLGGGGEGSLGLAGGGGSGGEGSLGLAGAAGGGGGEWSLLLVVVEERGPCALHRLLVVEKGPWALLLLVVGRGVPGPCVGCWGGGEGSLA